MLEEAENRDLYSSSATADAWIRLDRAKVVLYKSHLGGWWNQIILGIAMIFVGNSIQLIRKSEGHLLFSAVSVGLLIFYFVSYRFCVMSRGDKELEGQNKYYPGSVEQVGVVMENLKDFLQTDTGAKLSETGFDMTVAFGELKINVSGRGSSIAPFRDLETLT